MAKSNDSETLTLVSERLEHVALIFDLRHHYYDLSLIRDVGENGWTHPWRYFDALMYYLLLTCFDLLGQPGDWVPFSTWLESKKKNNERQHALESIPKNADPIAIAKHLSASYQAIYGVKNSFYNFILNVLTQEERDELFSNIDITRAVLGGDPCTSYPALGKITDERKKLDFLFSLRNKFTHSAVTMGSPTAGVFSGAYEPIVIEGKAYKGYVDIHREVKNGERIIYSVQDWPYCLQRIINNVVSRKSLSIDNRL
ncbi:hypothetical protein [Pseudomonas oryzihabitans]|uniref:hypothetical protein n=1 Tax=Pseudomonas oryzihabitans TaxID=47885 RepID=UPI00119F573F|nr:hypothetical protein [Pseudomonas oryzihabitans]QEU01939.1 hypothetical protein FOB65_00965 [Pseudomonas oryzihabitans]